MLLGINPAAYGVAPRFDVMACFHKTQRYLMCETLPRLSTLDVHDANGVLAALRQVREMLRHCEQVLEMENVFVVPQVERLCPNSGAILALLAEGRMQRIALLRDRCLLVEGDHDGSRERQVLALQREMTSFVANSLVELTRTEREANRILWPARSDGSLLQLEGEMLSAIGADKLQWSMHWMIPALNPVERGRVLALLQETAPLSSFEAVLAMSEDLLSRPEHERLLQALDRQPAGRSVRGNFAQ